MAKVFMSHKDVDSDTASVVARRLRAKGLDVYIDVVDPCLAKDGPELADYLRERMSECTQLMAIVSSSTKSSWWVPWEIGVASEKDFLIATFAYEWAELPGYLEKWPCLRSLDDVDRYANYGQDAELVILLETLLNKSSAPRKSAAKNFHYRLMRSLGQI